MGWRTRRRACAGNRRARTSPPPASPPRPPGHSALPPLGFSTKEMRIAASKFVCRLVNSLRATPPTSKQPLRHWGLLAGGGECEGGSVASAAGGRWGRAKPTSPRHTVLYGRRGRCTRSCVSCLDKDHLSTTRDRSSDVSRSKSFRMRVGTGSRPSPAVSLSAWFAMPQHHADEFDR
jgi:hypothetical protein